MSKSKWTCALPACTRARQRGAVVLLLLLCFLLASSYVVLKALNSAATHFPGTLQQQNAEILQRAREALLGYAAAHRELINDAPATKGPGYLPCPDRATDDADASNPAHIDPNREGVPTSNCGGRGLKLGRFPWRYLGTGELKDASGERLWYAVSDNFRYNNGAFPLNSNTAGTLCIDRNSDASCAGANQDATDVVAVIIAPGEALAHQQRSPYPNTAGYYNFSDYLEDDNVTAEDDRFTINARRDLNGDGAVDNRDFNDQLAFITRAELMQIIERRVTATINDPSHPPDQKPDKPPSSWLIANGWLDILGKTQSAASLQSQTLSSTSANGP
ncbi:MAG: hypothetical protein U1F34_00600 [Gammaproteobacteria bacterium]